MPIDRAAMVLAGIVALSLAAMIPTAALAQEAPSLNYTSFDATSAAPVQLGYYGAVHKDCTPAPPVTIRVSEPPKSGTFTILPGQLTTSASAKPCPGVTIPAEVVFYQARPDAAGTDRLSSLGRDRLARLDDQLFRRFVETNQGSLGITRLLVGFQHVFHRRDEGRVGVRRDHPLAIAVGLKRVFF